MMTQKYTLHTHTIGFDGQNSPQEMVNRARELGFDTIGISNHFIVNPVIKDSPMYKYSLRGGYADIYSSSFKEAIAHFVPHYEDLCAVQEQNPDMKILRGMEVDFFETYDWYRGFEKAFNILKPDYLIGSAHFIDYGGTLLNTHDWRVAAPEVQDELLKRYWTNISKAAESGLFNWMAHIDLPKKAGLGRDKKWADLENKAIEAVANAKCAIEINTSFYREDCYEPYPSNRIFQMIKQNNVPVLISDDAHKIENIGRKFDLADQIIKMRNLRRLAR